MYSELKKILCKLEQPVFVSELSAPDLSFTALAVVPDEISV